MILHDIFFNGVEVEIPGGFSRSGDQLMMHIEKCAWNEGRKSEGMFHIGRLWGQFLCIGVNRNIEIG